MRFAAHRAAPPAAPRPAHWLCRAPCGSCRFRRSDSFRSLTRNLLGTRKRMEMTRELLIERLDYDRIEEVRRDVEIATSEEAVIMRQQEFRIFQDTASTPAISILFDVSDGTQSLVHVAFALFHDHFDVSNDEAENVEAALQFVEKLIAREIGLLVTLDDGGGYKSGSIRPAGELTKPAENQRVYLFNGR